jgi:hypothetical protein
MDEKVILSNKCGLNRVKVVSDQWPVKFEIKRKKTHLPVPKPKIYVLVFFTTLYLYV